MPAMLNPMPAYKLLTLSRFLSVCVTLIAPYWFIIRVKQSSDQSQSSLVKPFQVICEPSS